MTEAQPPKMRLEPTVKPHTGFVRRNLDLLYAPHFTYPIQQRAISSAKASCDPQTQKQGQNCTGYAEKQIGKRPLWRAFFPKYREIERKRRESGEAAQNAGRHEQPQLIGTSEPAHEDFDEHPHREGADDVDH